MVHLTHLLRNLFYCAVFAAIGGLGELQSHLEMHAKLVTEAASEVPVSLKTELSPTTVAEAVSKIAKFIKDQGEDLQREPHTFLVRLVT